MMHASRLPDSPYDKIRRAHMAASAVMFHQPKANKAPGDKLPVCWIKWITVET